MKRGSNPLNSTCLFSACISLHFTRCFPKFLEVMNQCLKNLRRQFWEKKLLIFAFLLTCIYWFFRYTIGMSIILKAKSKTFIKHGHSNWFWIREEDASSPHSLRPSSVWRSLTRWCFHAYFLFIPLPWIDFFPSVLGHSWENADNYTELWCEEMFCSELAFLLFKSNFFFLLDFFFFC